MKGKQLKYAKLSGSSLALIGQWGKLFGKTANTDSKNTTLSWENTV